MTETRPHQRHLTRPTLFLVVACVVLIAAGAFCFWWPYHLEQLAIAAIKEWHGKAGARIVRPDWVSNSIDGSYLPLFQHVTSVELTYVPVGDAELKQLGGLVHLEYLDLSGTKVSDAGLCNFAE